MTNFDIQPPSKDYMDHFWETQIKPQIVEVVRPYPKRIKEIYTRVNYYQCNNMVHDICQHDNSRDKQRTEKRRG
jgi:hypothetical protein